MAKDLKTEIAQYAVTLLKPGQTIGLGMGRTIACLIEEILKHPDLADNLAFASSAPDTIELLKQSGLKFISQDSLDRVDFYFDGCDQLDKDLNALKSMGGIHSAEKSMAAIAGHFILLATAEKLRDELDHEFPFVLEVLPLTVFAISQKIMRDFPGAEVVRRDQKTALGNILLNVWFKKLPPLQALNTVKMIPGVIDHSLFYLMANGAIIAGDEGARLLQRA
jgi:ribose 5-phosphate isomerase A